MFSWFSLLVVISLLVYGASSEPRSAWGKMDDTAVQETLMSVGEDKLPLGLKEVEPPQDMDAPDLDIDPSMLIWRAVQESRRRAVEEARAHVGARADAHADAHPRPAEDHHAQQPCAAASGPQYHQAEPDMDEVYHNFPAQAGPAEQTDRLAQETRRGRYAQAEVDLDDIYHGDQGQLQVLPQVEPEPQDDVSMPDHRGRSLPEEDLDDLYHKY
ncbi:uncharacterized protein si:ch211-217g15.3 isoform X1 [Alosa alosa]|uniref:uncharacterized protein si:ch211-217g15.3 isoform X1 n=1 Tax=Alosa alosa TaxID=278164 RepID=UPI0020150C20|nr:uncharacterized protein si:ch211-217g15.3 isoform X1 [Alosa alosa]